MFVKKVSVRILEISLLRRVCLTDEKYHSIIYGSFYYIPVKYNDLHHLHVYIRGKKRRPALFPEYCCIIQSISYVSEQNLWSNFRTDGRKQKKNIQHIGSDLSEIR